MMFPTFIIFDAERMRPACVLIQAAFGASSYIAQEFPAETWLVVPTEGMKKYQLDNKEQLEKLVRLAMAATEREKSHSPKSQGT